MSRKLIPLDRWGNPIEYDRHERSVFHTGPDHPRYSFVDGYPVAKTSVSNDTANKEENHELPRLHH